MWECLHMYRSPCTAIYLFVCSAFSHIDAEGMQEGREGGVRNKDDEE